MNRTAAVLCALGIPAVVETAIPYPNHHRSLFPIGLLMAAMIGVVRATGQRVAWVSFGLLGASAVFGLVSDLLPQPIFEDTPEVVFRVCYHFGAMLVIAAIAIVSIATRKRVGVALTALTLFALAVSAIVSALFVVLPESLMRSSFGMWLDMIGTGWANVLPALFASSLALIGVGPTGLEPSTRKGFAITAAIGTALLAAAVSSTPEELRGGHAFPALALLATMGVAWIVIAIGFAGLAKERFGGTAWAVLGLAIAHLIICGPLPFIGHAVDDHIRVVIAPVGLGMLGLAIAMLAARNAPLPTMRLAVGALLVLGTLGSCFTSSGIVLHEALDMHIRDADWGITRLTMTFGVMGMSAVAAYLAILATPPSSAEEPSK
jgi:hypothetical protein